MKLTAEISMYPFAENYKAPIKAFIEQLNSYPGITLNTGPTATVLVGDYDVLMDALKDAVAWSYREFGKCVFVTKLITDYEAKN